MIQKFPAERSASLPPVRVSSSIVPARRLMAAEMQGGTFTVTNLGPMGIEMFTPLINLPECAALGLVESKNKSSSTTSNSSPAIAGRFADV